MNLPITAFTFLKFSFNFDVLVKVIYLIHEICVNQVYLHAGFTFLIFFFFVDFRMQQSGQLVSKN
jgi:hypothetical protein